jgi:hypothetical protein
MYNPLEKTTSTASVSSRPGVRILRGFPLVALMLFITVMDAPSLGGEVGRGSAPYLPNDRVILLTAQLADQAHLSQDILFAMRAQAQAGLLIWPYDRDQARAIFWRAFQQLLPTASDFQPDSALERANMQRLRVEFLNQIAYLDSEMAETMVRAFALSRKPLIAERVGFAPFDSASSLIASRGPVDAESRELLVGVALRMAEADRARAAALGELSLEAGISPYFDRLLMLIRETEPALADRLFSKAVDYLERAKRVPPGDVHTLSFYLISSADISDKDCMTQAVIVRFLNLAFDVVMRNCSVSQAAARPEVTDQSFEIYSTGKYLMELLPRYLPHRAAQLQRRLSEMNDRESSGAMTGISAAQSVHPCAIEQAASNSADERDRDLLYARATFGWLARGELCEAQRTALNIANVEMRDRVLHPVARRLMSKARITHAMLVVELIQDRVAKTGLIIRLAQAAFSLRNTAHARTLLNLAEQEAGKIECPFARAQSLLAIVAGFSAFEPDRAFAVMQRAVKSINEIPAREPQALNPEQTASRVANAQTEELFHLGFANSLTALARLDFDRALLLSQQLTDKEISLIAQLAVCHGGLRPAGPKQR